MASVAWSKPTPTATAWNNSELIPNLGVLMNDTVYLMNDTVAKMNDSKSNPIFAAATAWGRPVV